MEHPIFFTPLEEFAKENIRYRVEKTVDPISHAIGREKFYTCVRFEDGCEEIDDEDYPAYASVRLIKDAE